MLAQPDEVINIMNAVNVFLEWKSMNDSHRDQEVYHPSEWGKCLRKVQYLRYSERNYIPLPSPSPRDPQLSRIFDTGHSMHHRWANYFNQMGVLRGWWRCGNISCSKIYGQENKIGIFSPKKCSSCGSSQLHYMEVAVEDKSLNFKGNADQILDFSNFDVSRFQKGNPVQVLFDPDRLPKTPIVNDMKTINSNQFDPKGFNKGAMLPKAEHRIQICIYANILDLDYGTIIYENKDTSAVKMFQVDKNPPLWNKIKEQATKMNAMLPDKLLPPPRLEKKDNYECRDCPFRSICHSSKIWDDPHLNEKRQKFYSMSIDET